MRKSADVLCDFILNKREVLLMKMNYVVYWKNSKGNIFRETFEAKSVYDLIEQLKCIMLEYEIITDIYKAK